MVFAIIILLIIVAFIAKLVYDVQKFKMKKNTENVVETTVEVPEEFTDTI